MKLIDKDVLVAEIKRRIKYDEMVMNHDSQITELLSRELNTLYELLSFIKSLEVKEVNEVPATVMVNKYGNRFIYSWSGLKEYDDFKEGQEIKILIPNK